MSDAGQVAMFLALGAAAMGLFLGPLGAALARRIGGPDDDEGRELDELRDRIHALEAQQDRVAEVESRLDFAERVLAQQPSALPPGARNDESIQG
jgi:hypothetical protein